MGAAGRDMNPWYDSQAGYYDDDGKDLRVEVKDFQTFSQNVRLEMNNFIANWNSAVFPLMKTCSHAFGNKGTFLEAAWTKAHHGGAADGAAYLMKDLGLGFQAISTAAITMSIEYQNGDAEGAEGLDPIFSTFYPDSDENSLEKMREQAEEEGQNGEGEQPGDTTATDTPPPAQENPYADADGDGVPDDVEAPDDDTPADDPTTVGSGNGQVTIPGDPYTEVPEMEEPD